MFIAVVATEFQILWPYGWSVEGVLTIEAEEVQELVKHKFKAVQLKHLLLLFAVWFEGTISTSSPSEEKIPEADL